MAHISLLATGGTISTQYGAAGATPGLDAEAIAGALHRRGEPVSVRTRDVLQISSRNMTPLAMWQIARAVQEEIDAGAQGVVITHGTDTLEETAYALSLVLPVSVPIVLTGAMRVPGSPGEDGPANLAAALAVASDPAFAAYGPVVVHQDEIHLARWVTKTYSTRVAAFTSPASGPIGIVVEGRAVPLAGPLPRPLVTHAAAPDKCVEIIWSAAGTGGWIVDAISSHVDGIVVAAAGGGHVAHSLAESLVRAVGKGVAVVLASRCPAPQVLQHTYGGAGGEIQLLAAGLLPAGDLAPAKARLRLIFGLSAGHPAAALFPPAPAGQPQGSRAADRSP